MGRGGLDVQHERIAMFSIFGAEEIHGYRLCSRWQTGNGRKTCAGGIRCDSGLRTTGYCRVEHCPMSRSGCTSRETLVGASIDPMEFHDLGTDPHVAG